MNIINLLKKKCKSTDNTITLQLNLDNSGRTIRKLSNSLSNDPYIDNGISKIIPLDPQLNGYTVSKTLHDKFNKGIFIISTNNNNFFMKIHRKSSYDDDNIKCKVINILSKLSHNNVVTVYNCHTFNDYIFTIKEYFDSNNLCTFSQHNIISQNIGLDIILQIAHGLNFIHHNSIIHCDIKPENILIDSDLHVKITDYDLAKICDKNGEYQSDHVFGTSPYIAPESLSIYLYSKWSDIWSLGILSFVIIKKKFPFDEEISVADNSSCLSRRNIFKHMGSSLESLELYHAKLYHLIQRMLIFKDSDRIPLSDIILFIQKN